MRSRLVRSVSPCSRASWWPWCSPAPSPSPPMTSDSPRVPLPALEDATPEVHRLFDAFVRERGNVPNLFRAASLRPPIVLTLFAHLRAVTGPGEVPVLLKELLTVRVSNLNACGYCLASHTALSRKHGATDEQITW